MAAPEQATRDIGLVNASLALEGFSRVSSRIDEGFSMLDAAIGHEGDGSTRSQLLLVADKSGDEQGLRSAIQTLERRGDASRGALAVSLIKLGKLTQEKGNDAEAERLFRKALEIAHDALPALDPHLLPALISLAGYCVLRGALNDAEPLLSRALSVSERHADLEQSDVGLLLNDLVRICLKQSAYHLAEPLLVRLLAIKQSKGENRPEVATVLASLASVRQALGHHESAEQMWRRVLEIRERTLAPNHFSVASALEHLAESCAARGKIDEALQLYQRAQTIRQLTLGNNHSSLRITRDRIADLQLQNAEVSVSGPETPHAPVSPPDGFRLRFPTERRMISPVLLVPPTREPPSISEEERAGSNTILESVRSPLVDTPAGESQLGEGPNRATTNSEMAVTTYQNILLSIAEELGDASVDRAQRFDRIIAAWASGFLVQNKRNLAIAGAGMLAIVLGAWVWNSNAMRNGNRVGEDQQAPPASVAALAVPIRSPAANNDSQVGSLTLRATAPVVPTRGRASEATRRGSDWRESNSVAIPKTFAATMPGVDSAVTAAGAATRSLAASLTPDFGPPPTLAQRSSFVDNADQANSRGRHARLIGDLPAPILPTAARGMEGEVVVSFTVDAEGRPIMSTVSFVRSPDPILSSAVRKVIPALRFDPARSGGPDADRVPETVEVTYRFAAAKR